MDVIWDPGPVPQWRVEVLINDRFIERMELHKHVLKKNKI